MKNNKYANRQKQLKMKKPYGHFTKKDITKYVQSLFNKAYKKTSL